MEKTQGIRYSHASQPIEATGAALCPYSATVYAQFCSFKDECLGLLGRDNRALASTTQGEYSFQ